MLAAASSHHGDASAYWSAIVTTVPVLALAIVIEGRRSAVRFSEAGWLYRAFNTLIFFGYAAALIWSFDIALDALVAGDGFQRAPLTNSLLGGVLLILVLLPLFDLSLRLNPEAVRFLARALPWGPYWRSRRGLRRLRREIRQTAKGIRKDLDEVRAQLPDIEQGIERARESVQMYWGFLAMKEHVTGEHAEEVASVAEEVQAKAIEAGVAQLRPGATVGLLELGLARVHRHIGFLESHLDEGQRLLRAVEVQIRSLAVFRTDLKDRRRIKDELEEARREWMAGL